MHELIQAISFAKEEKLILLFNLCYMRHTNTDFKTLEHHFFILKK